MTAHEQDETTMGQNPGADGDVGAGHGDDTQAGGHPTGTEQPRPEELEEDGGFDEGQREGGVPGYAPDLEEDGGFDEGQREGGVPGNAPEHDHDGGIR